MRIVIDLQGAQSESRFRGIGRYSLSLAKAIVRNRGEHEVIIVLSGLFNETIEPIRAEFAELLPQSNIRVWSAPAPVSEFDRRNSWRRETAELIREAFFASLEPDIIHIMSLFEGFHDDVVTSIGCFDKSTPVSVSFFDLIPLMNPNQYLKPNPPYEVHYRQKYAHLKKASLLLAISNSSLSEGMEYLGDDSSIVNVSTAADANFCPLDISPAQAKSLSEKYGITRPFLMYTGGGDERKNLPRLIRAFAKMPEKLRSAHQLVLVGRIANIEELRKKAKSAGLTTDECIDTGYVSDDELVQLYNSCKLFVYPSWHEGFGLPVLEAMSCGAAAIASDTSSLPEIVSNDAALFDPFSERSLRKKIIQVLTDDDFCQSLIDSGLEQSTLFSWDISAKIAIQAFENHLEDRIPQPLDEMDLEPKLIEAIVSQKNKTNSPSEYDLIFSAHSISVNLEKRQLPKLYVDVSQLVVIDYRTGIQRVVRSVITAWLDNPPEGWEVEPVYLTSETGFWHYRSAADFKNSLLPDQRKASEHIIEPLFGDVFLGLDLYSSVCGPIEEGMFARWKDRGVQIHFVIYDILPILNPQWWPEGGAEAHTRWLGCIAQAADSLICISNSVSNEVQEWLQDNPSDRFRPLKFSWFHLGADVENSEHSLGIPKDGHTVLKALSDQISFLMVGTIEPRKGHAQTLVAFEELWARGEQVALVIVGKEGWLVDSFVEKLRSHFELGRRLFWFEWASDEYLGEIYKASDCLIAASQGEGFGLPLIEAAQHKVSIIAQDIPVFREVAGEHAFYFSGTSATILNRALQNWLALYEAGRHPKSDLMPWLSWRESAQQLLEVLGVTTSEAAVKSKPLAKSAKATGLADQRVS